ncbi:PREDICTED: reversion-inducing cysteine-rich protein with Kazal motifs-like [Papilio polytes]|uniref:reversion-inducing cysteine-rich protein with Kazal motifs-like n=1 Tax=Papilio polytes TaxID=76194 RepID=UPI00067659C1|nr:PREDICTED: reversion-inducing cysteine-rich protein with Kazal motifs-like [Papilio polytes]
MNGARKNENIKNINTTECSRSKSSCKTKVCRKRTRGAQSGCGWWTKLIIASFTLAFVESQELSACCSKANGTCRSVCEKMSLGSSIREERIQNIYKFCTPDLIEFWICMNQTIQEVVSGSGWWGKTCCALAHGGQCRHACAAADACLTQFKGTVCGLNGVTYMSECAAWSEYVSVDYLGPCFAVGPISDLMEPKCGFDRIVCPPLKKPKCIGFTAPGACCPKCGGALRILYAKKQFDRALYGTNISDNVVHLNNILKTLERHIKIAECALRGYLTVEMELFISVETLLDNPTDLQLKVCILEAEKLGDLINRGSALITSDVALCALSYAIPVHTTPTQSAASFSISIALVFISTLFALIPR